MSSIKPGTRKVLGTRGVGDPGGGGVWGPGGGLGTRGETWPGPLGDPSPGPEPQDGDAGEGVT